MTEVSSPITSGGWLTDRNYGCGSVRPGFQCRVVDEFDREVPDGMPGELVIRPEEPWTTFTEYWRNDAATNAAFRNLWFHTGDLVVREPDGWFTYKDRLKDVIRRRGENISSMELEATIRTQPGIEDVAAYGVPSQLGEEDVMVALVTTDEFEGAASLHLALRALLPRHMVPRYYRVVPELPKTPTEKVRVARDGGGWCAR
jgi:crotonobetaine/carnitine-CoA ligase